MSQLYCNILQQQKKALNISAAMVPMVVRDPARGGGGTSRLFGSAGPSQRPDQILYLAETKGIVRILSGFKRQSEGGNGGAYLTLKT